MGNSELMYDYVLDEYYDNDEKYIDTEIEDDLEEDDYN